MFTNGTVTSWLYIHIETLILPMANKKEVDADDTSMSLLTGVEFTIILLRLGISAEFAGDYKAYHIALRYQFR